MSRTTWPVYSPFAKEHFGRGRQEGFEQGFEQGFRDGLAKAVLRVLAARGVEASDDVRARIRECADLPQLEAWLGRAVTGVTVADLFD